MKFNVIILGLIFLFSCEVKQKSIGPYDRIIVFGDTKLYDSSIDSIRHYMSEARELPILEDLFEFEYRPLKEFKKFNQYRNIMILISKESPNEYNQLVDALLSEEAKQGVTDNRYNFFLTKNLYAENQSVLLLISNTDADMKELISDQVNRLTTFDDFKESVLNRYSDQVVYGYNHIEATAETMMKQHGYSIDHSKYYTAIENNLGVDSNIVSYFASAPLRYYFVKYFEDVENHSINGYLDLRDKAHKMHFEGDLIVRDNIVYVDSIKHNGNNFLKIQSTYMTFDENDQIIGGGPCITYYLQDGNRTYVIDGSVFKPGNRKSLELIQLEIILRTFKLKQGA